MKKLSLLLAGALLAATLVVSGDTSVEAADYVLTSQAQDLYNSAQNELNQAYRDKDNAQRRVDELRNCGISGYQLDDAVNNLNNCYNNIGRKEDKVRRARYVLDFVNSRTDSEIFLAGMQEKFKNQASLGPMKDRIDGAKSIISAQTTQIQVIQDAIKSQTALAQVNPAIFSQVQELNASYQQELAQLQAQQQELEHLQKQYNDFAATMPMPTMEDNMRLSEIRSDFSNCCREFDAACAE